MEIVTGHRGTPHITPYKVRDFNIGTVGAEDYVINSGSELEAHLVSNNRIDIKDGSICMQGTHAVIPKNINDELTIENGMQGEKRIDLIVARYEKVADSGVESVNTVVLQGTPSKETPNVPGHVVGDIRNGDLKHEMPLYEVELDGINITEVRPVFKKLVSVAEQQKMIESLNGNIRIEKFSADGIGINSPVWKVIFSNVYKQNGVVHFMAQAYTTAPTVANAEYIVFNLPEELKPSHNDGVTATASDVNGNNACACYSNVDTSGALKVKIPNSTCKYVIFNAIWFTD